MPIRMGTRNSRHRGNTETNKQGSNAMDLKLAGKKVIITGGSRGIGRASAELFAAEGAHVAFVSRNADQVAEAKASLSRHGGKVVGDALDVSDRDAFKTWLGGAAEQLGGCDIFYHGSSNSGAANGTMDWQACFDIDMLAAVAGCETLEPHLAASGSGSVILMSSTAAVETFVYPQAFNAIKAAVITYAKQLSQLWGPKQIRVNAVSPGPTAFPGGNWEGIKAGMPDFYTATVAAAPLGRLGAAEDVARSIVFLSSPAASYITGINLVIDGGYTKRVQF
jgi:NAD(P)-dependent dehydrogenase (short-subunit alcohol dehydrogenase family)